MLTLATRTRVSRAVSVLSVRRRPYMVDQSLLSGGSPRTILTNSGQRPIIVLNSVVSGRYAQYVMYGRTSHR